MNIVIGWDCSETHFVYYVFDPETMRKYAHNFEYRIANSEHDIIDARRVCNRLGSSLCSLCVCVSVCCPIICSCLRALHHLSRLTRNSDGTPTNTSTIVCTMLVSHRRIAKSFINNRECIRIIIVGLRSIRTMLLMMESTLHIDGEHNYITPRNHSRVLGSNHTRTHLCGAQ